jgi:hypothetical protein
MQKQRSVPRVRKSPLLAPGSLNNLPERNQQIFQMALAGVSHRKLALAFGLSKSRIRLVISAIRRENALAKRRRSIADEIRQVDDLDRLWEVADLVDVLGALRAAQNALLRHFASLNQEQISLRQMMDLAIPETADSDGCNSPLSRISFIGKKGYWSIINGVSEITLNRRCGQEWGRKLVWLERLLRARGHLGNSPDGPWLRLVYPLRQ